MTLSAITHDQGFTMHATHIHSDYLLWPDSQTYIHRYVYTTKLMIKESKEGVPATIVQTLAILMIIHLYIYIYISYLLSNLS